ncbi:PepSY-associated TM helix domain-containing protein [Aestuariivivens insulae]|uniref:PepSY-associated TM helix domain-containing protein n=1 Tax=Aestuariivivens insulae TaxID=1621988 RepID=UPI001F59E443|nr:PepSY-associated TM helix domain-containing protein [Aestuariivivens insulae]
MKNRTYNILFHTHTISGIVISVVLYIIFFAGSFSFFRDEIVNWERNQSVTITDDIQLDLNTALDTLNGRYNLNGRDIEFKKYYIEQRVGVSISASKDSLASEEAKRTDFFYLDTKAYTQNTYQNSYTLGEFLYRLHFLAQIPYPFGYYLSGFVAFFFLFAILTGLIIHWKKIVSNFFLFRPFKKLKTLWTDAHTALGTIGLPFQFVYAVTGAFFMIKLLLIAPNVMVLYDGDQAKFYEDLGYSHPHFELNGETLGGNFNLNAYVERTKQMWSGFNTSEIHISNYNDTNMHVSISGHLDYGSKFNGLGEAIYKVNNNDLVFKKDPTLKTSYVDSVKNILYRIHFADYGSYALKILSFILGIISCFVIISGVMIWFVARNKNNVSLKKRLFNLRVVRVYLAVCLSMYPITAASFIMVKVFQPQTPSFIYNFYFIGWLMLVIYFIRKKDIAFINKYTLLSGSVLGLMVPVANGLTTKNWIWSSFANQQYQIWFIDTFWLILSFITLWIFLRLKKSSK